MKSMESIDDFTIVSSTDHHFAISDAIRKHILEIKESLLICTPYVSKDFFDMIRTLPNGSTLKLVTRVPDEKDKYLFGRTCRAIEALIQISNSLGLKLDIVCKPNLHAKFIVIDWKTVLSGSVNPTSSGMYDNDEILYVFMNPIDVNRHVKIFNKMWNCPRNTTWEKFQLYSGRKSYGDNHPTHKAIAKQVIRFFDLNGNQTALKSVLCERIAKRGYDKNDVIETVKALIRDGKLYEPKPDTLKLVD